MIQRYAVNRENVAAYGRMFDVSVAEDELDSLVPRLAVIMADIARLWEEDVSDIEMALIYPVGRGAG